MARRRDELRYGRIVWAVVADPRGNRKRRPAVVMDPRNPAEIIVMPITTTFSDPPPPHHVMLPWNADARKVGTRLARRSAAVVTWLDVIDSQDIEEMTGDVPAGIMAEIDRQITELAKGK